MKFRFFNILRSFDDFGHPMSLTYKGEETFQTSLGGLLSIAVRVLTLIMAIKAAVEVFMMYEPKINSLAKPLSVDDRNEMGELLLSEHGLYLGLEAHVANSSDLLPPEVGHITAGIYNQTTKGMIQELSLQNCQNVLPETF